MEKLGLIHGISNGGVPYCCASCVKSEPNGSIYAMIRCDKGTLMRPDGYCDMDFSLDETRTTLEVIDLVKKYIELNTGKM